LAFIRLAIALGARKPSLGMAVHSVDNGRSQEQACARVRGGTCFYLYGFGR